MRFQIIESSSAGNCAFFDTGRAKILIDAGIGVRKIESYLQSLNLNLDDIDAVFITHEHSDHYKALGSLAKYQNIKIFANKLTAESICYLDEKTKILPWCRFETGGTFEFMGMQVRSFPIPHDTSDAVGYSFTFDDYTLVWATDLGKVTKLVADVLKQANVLVLESNYCPVMLERSPRPYKLKQRIMNSHGHLSNADAITALRELNADTLKKVYFAHISRECNSVSHIKDLLLKAELPFDIELVSPCTLSSMEVFEF